MSDLFDWLTGDRSINTNALSAVGVAALLGHQLHWSVSTAVAIVGVGAIVGEGAIRRSIEEQRPLSFADPRTHFKLLRGEEGETGGHINEPTGEIRCELCDATHTNIDEIPHNEDCPQRFVHSGFYVRKTRRGEVRVNRDDR
jgi:hypothetical protein